MKEKVNGYINNSKSLYKFKYKWLLDKSYECKLFTQKWTNIPIQTTIMYTNIKINTLGFIILGFKGTLFRFGIAKTRGATIGNDLFLLYACHNLLMI